MIKSTSVTIDYINCIISMCRILSKRNLDKQIIKENLRRLYNNEDFKVILKKLEEVNKEYYMSCSLCHNPECDGCQCWEKDLL